ncbi:MAG: SpoIIE family protein phosphatase [Thermoleophilia bacterium]|nr:SpoIIE family protein phosphatase [Thermoleophilia bacterium]
MLVGVILAIDLSDPSEPITVGLILGPFLASLLCTARQTAVVAVVAVLCALPTTGVEDADPVFHALRVALVVLGSGLAAISARERSRSARGRARLGVLADLAELSARRHGAEEAAGRLAQLVVPRAAAACVIDVFGDRLTHRPAGRAVAGAASELGEVPDVAPDGAPVIRRVTGGGDVRWMVVAPIRSEGRAVGRLTLGTRHGLGRSDLPFVRALAGRAGLVLENAGLSADLAVAERRFETALDEMAAAVLIQRPGEGIVYANQAAADAMELADPAAVIAATPEEIGHAWESHLEDGSTLHPQDYPSAQILTGVNRHPPPLLVRGVHRASGVERWLSVRATPVIGQDGEVEMAVSVTEDITAIKRAELVQRILAHAGEVLHRSSDPEAPLQDLADLLVPDVADWCTITLPGRETMRLVAVAHRDPAMRGRAAGYAARFPGRMDAPTGGAEILRGGPPLLVSRVTDEILRAYTQDAEHLHALRAAGMRSVIQVPICPPDGEAAGVISLVNAESHRTFTDADLELAQELGRRAGVAMETARLSAERSRIAATLQTSLLPERLPEVPGMQLAGSYRAAGRTTWAGGDFYDVFETPAGWMAVVGDVTGHGAGAAAVTAKARHTLRTAGVLTGDPVRGLELLNRQLAARDEVTMCSACVVLLPRGEDEPGHARVACAGHPRPVRIRAGLAEEVGSWGTMLGAFADTTFEEDEILLLPGDTLLLYTDGVLDARGGGDRFGAGRLAAAVTPASGAQDAIGRVDRALEAFADGEEQADDIAMLAVRRTGRRDITYGDPGNADPEITAVRAVYDAFARRDMEAALAHMDPAIELHLRATGELAGRDGPYRGHDGAREYFADLERVWDELELHADDIRAAAGAVVVFGRVTGRRGDEQLQRSVMWSWTVRDGLATSVRANDMGPVRTPRG